MTPDHHGYHPCPTCGVLAPEGKPHPADFCARERFADPDPPKPALQPLLPAEYEMECGARRREGRCVLVSGHDGDHETDYGWKFP